jgi:hypothetical protein
LEPSTRPYKAFDCGDDCHPIRYAAFTTRTWWGSKRWGVTDRHMGVRLSRLCKSGDDVESWLGFLLRMEIRERRATEKRAGQRA